MASIKKKNNKGQSFLSLKFCFDFIFGHGYLLRSYKQRRRKMFSKYSLCIYFNALNNVMI